VPYYSTYRRIATDVAAPLFFLLCIPFIHSKILRRSAHIKLSANSLHKVTQKAWLSKMHHQSIKKSEIARETHQRKVKFIQEKGRPFFDAASSLISPNTCVQDNEWHGAQPITRMRVMKGPLVCVILKGAALACLMHTRVKFNTGAAGT
jgi:hypothetical protein